MRPPHYTGEDLAILPRHLEDGLPASMRPPHYTGEDRLFGRISRGFAGASMRPPHYTGEDFGGRPPGVHGLSMLQ